MDLYILKSSKIIIFDWDDTLCPTTTLNLINNIQNNIYIDNNTLNKHTNIKDPNFIKLEINKIDNTNLNLLKKSNELGNNIIISNATVDWIKFTGINYLPLTYNFIVNNNIPIISAREFSLQNNIKNPLEWKNYTFYIYLNKIINNNIETIISIGDSNTEHIALNKYNQYIKNYNINIIVKTIKYIENPIIQDIYKQNIILSKNIHSILNNNKNNTYYIKPLS